MPIRLTGLTSGLDTESIISELVSAYRTKEQKYVKAQTKLSWTQDIWKSLNSKIYSMYTGTGELRLSSAWSAQKVSVSNSNYATVTSSGSAVTGTQSLDIAQLAKASYITGGKLTDSSTSSTAKKTTTLANLGFSASGSDYITVTKAGQSTGTQIAVTGSTTLSDLASAISQISGVKASYDETNGRFFVSSTDSGTANAVILSDNSGGSTDTSTSTGGVLSALKLLTGDGASTIVAQDAKITLNGADYTSSSNQFIINGLTINALAETGTDTLSITTATDSQALYDKTKDFLSQYNTLINAMTSYYNADSAKGYEPLTSEEKSAMSDTEVEQWEAKIKSSLLRRDDSLDRIMNLMENAMSSAYYIYNGAAVSYNSKAGYYEYNGTALQDGSGNNITNQTDLQTWATSVGAKKYSLSSFGISTLGILNSAENQENAYHINGDSDDSTTASKTDQLLAAWNSNPEDTQAFMQQLTKDLYNNISQEMNQSNNLRSIHTVYNDKEMAQEYSDYTKTISDWETKLNDMENYYYSKFAAMESALTQLQGQQSSLSSLLG